MRRQAHEGACDERRHHHRAGRPYRHPRARPRSRHGILRGSGLQARCTRSRSMPSPSSATRRASRSTSSSTPMPAIPAKNILMDRGREIRGLYPCGAARHLDPGHHRRAQGQRHHHHPGTVRLRRRLAMSRSSCATPTATSSSCAAAARSRSRGSRPTCREEACGRDQRRLALNLSSAAEPGQSSASPSALSGVVDRVEMVVQVVRRPGST